MKTAIVMKTDGKKATLLYSDGLMIRVPAKPGWKKGSVVQANPIVKKPPIFFVRIAAVAACFVLFALVGFGGYGFINSTVAWVSMDINPSIELHLNRFGTVIDGSAFNDDGEVLLSQLSLKGLSYQDAITRLLQSDGLKPYLDKNDYLAFSYYGETLDSEIGNFLQNAAQQVETRHQGMQTECYRVNRDDLEQAHHNGMTAGKMRKARELSSLDPSVSIGSCREVGIGELRRRVNALDGSGHGNGAPGNQDAPDGRGNGHGNSATPDATPQPGTGHGNGTGKQHGRQSGEDSSTASKPQPESAAEEKTSTSAPPPSAP